jgi:hypothetical protein
MKNKTRRKCWRPQSPLPSRLTRDFKKWMP